MKIGFIGLGNQGGPIARRIARSGFELIACDIDAQTLAAFDEPNVTRSADPMETARQVDALCVCVRMDKDLIDLVAGGALFEALGHGGVFIVHSTVEADLCRELTRVAKQHGVDLIDAGVSGGGPAALNGTLSLFVGGDAAAVERVRPLLASYGKVAHLGPVGRGMEGKLLNNLVSIANYGMSAAILDLGEQLQFDRTQLRDALLAGSADAYALRAVSGMLQPERADWVHQLFQKDLEHARALAPNDDFSMPALLAAAQSMLDRLQRIKDSSGHQPPRRH